jgi:hypothetical protein
MPTKLVKTVLNVWSAVAALAVPFFMWLAYQLSQELAQIEAQRQQFKVMVVEGDIVFRGPRGSDSSIQDVSIIPLFGDSGGPLQRGEVIRIPNEALQQRRELDSYHLRDFRGIVCGDPNNSPNCTTPIAQLEVTFGVNGSLDTDAVQVH